MSTTFKILFSTLIAAVLLSSGCAKIPVISGPPEGVSSKPASGTPDQEQATDIKDTADPGPAPRIVASLRLTEQARLLIEADRPDDAISILEKAVNINPDNGRNYYLLAEAWILKGNKKQALEFNRMAGIYPDKDPAWAYRIRQQKERIEAIMPAGKSKPE